MRSTALRWMALSFVGVILLHVLLFFGCTIAGHFWPGTPTPLMPLDIAAIEAEIGPTDGGLVGAIKSPLPRGGRVHRMGYEELRFDASFVAYDVRIENPRWMMPDYEEVQLRRVAVGWPARCFQHQTIEREITPVMLKARSMDIRLDPWAVSHEIVYPTTPIWRGIAVNSLIYFVLVFAAVFLLRFNPVRRKLRLRRGLCPKCAYPIGTNERCTECGEFLPVARTPRAG